METKKTGHTEKKPDTFKKLWGYLSYRKIGVIVCFLLVFVGTGATLLVNYQIKPIMNDYLIPQDWDGLLKSIMYLLSIVLIGAMASWTQMQVILRIAYGALENIRKDLFSKIQKLPISFFDSRSHGDIMSYYTNDIEALQTCLDQSIVMVLNNLVRIVGTIFLMYFLSPKLLIITLVMTVIMLVSLNTISNRSQKYFVAQQRAIGALSGYGEEMISGHETIQAFSHGNSAKKDFRKLNKVYCDSSTKAQSFSGSIMPIINQINSINFAITAVVGTILVIDGNLDIGALSAYLILTTNYNDPFKQISMQIGNVLQGLAGARRIFSVMELPEEEDTGKTSLSRINNSLVWNRPLQGQESEMIPFKGNICFENVSFAYEQGKQIIKNISFYAKPGQKIALVGSTGSGKTTIANLINRFYNIENGRITYDGIDIRDIKETDLRQSLGMVLQDTHLFTGTIMENIRYGRLDATDDEVITAAKFARADYFISQLPNGYNTFLEKDGESLSSGQRQLISIARTAIADPSVLILDEATSSVDTRTEVFVSKGMDALMKGRTVFVIAHRLSTVRDADAILVLEQGEIIERGNHGSLMEEHGRYYQLNIGLAELA